MEDEADVLGVGITEAEELYGLGVSVGFELVVLVPIDQQLAPNNAATVIPINLCRLIFASNLYLVKFAHYFMCLIHMVFKVLVPFNKRYCRSELCVNAASSLTQLPFAAEPFFPKINALSSAE